jgi:hypothetical protein
MQFYRSQPTFRNNVRGISVKTSDLTILHYGARSWRSFVLRDQMAKEIVVL